MFPFSYNPHNTILSCTGAGRTVCLCCFQWKTGATIVLPWGKDTPYLRLHCSSLIGWLRVESLFLVEPDQHPAALHCLRNKAGIQHKCRVLPCLQFPTHLPSGTFFHLQSTHPILWFPLCPPPAPLVWPVQCKIMWGPCKCLSAPVCPLQQVVQTCLIACLQHP